MAGETDVYSASGPLGSVSNSKFGTTFNPADFQQQFADLFRSIGAGSLQQAQGMPVQGQQQPFDLKAALANFGQTAGTQQLDQAGQGATGLSQMFGNALQGFNPDQFAATQFGRLENLARPGEQQAANSLANRLFSRGRLGSGDTTAGRAFGELGLAQSQARDSRALSALNLAGTEADRLASMAQMFGNLGIGQQTAGSNIAGGNIANITGSFTPQRQDQEFMNSLRTMLLNEGGASLGGINQAFAPLQQQFQNALNLGNFDVNRFSAKKAGQSQGGWEEFMAPVLGGIGTAVAGPLGGMFGSTVGNLFRQPGINSEGGLTYPGQSVLG